MPVRHLRANTLCPAIGRGQLCQRSHITQIPSKLMQQLPVILGRLHNCASEMDVEKPG